MGDSNRAVRAIGRCCFDGMQERRNARASQGNKGLVGLATQAFEHERGGMADAIDRANGQMGSADHAGQQFRAFFHTAIVMQKFT